MASAEAQFLADSPPLARSFDNFERPTEILSAPLWKIAPIAHIRPAMFNKWKLFLKVFEQQFASSIIQNVGGMNLRFEQEFERINQ